MCHNRSWGGCSCIRASTTDERPREPRTNQGLLLYTGLDLLSVWVVRMRRQLPVVDYALVLLILGVMAVGGCLPGLSAGVLVAISLCIINYPCAQERDSG